MSQVELNIEVSDAEYYIIKEMQKKNLMNNIPHLLKRKIYSKLLGLCPKLDIEKIIRSDG